MYHKYILLILNCQKYRWKAQLQKKIWLTNEIKYFHVVGDPLKCNGDVFCIDNEASIIYTNTKDDYLSLPHKMICAIAAIHSTFTYDYIFKTDDDQILINPHFFNEISSKLGPNIHYGGHVLTVDTHKSSYWEVQDILPRDLILEGTTYCTGRFYLLSYVAISALLQNVIPISKRIIEDHTMGFFLPNSFKQDILYLNNEVSASFIDYDKYVNDNYYIYTECVNCPEICVNALISFFEYHPIYKVHVYMTKNDAKYVCKYINNSNLVIEYVDDSIINVYNKDGHLGTATIWEEVIRSKMTKKIIHFDSDVIMRSDIINDIISELNNFDLVGPIRCYKNNLNNRVDICDKPDVVSTYCFGFNPKKIGIENYDSKMLIEMVRGYKNPLGFDVLDFFDPISFIIINNGGRVKFIDNNIIGGMDSNGSKINNHSILNTIMDCGDKIIHFSSVGSATNFYKAIKIGQPIHVSESYIRHSFKTFAIYIYLLFNKTSDFLPSEVNSLRPYFQSLTSLKFIDIET